MTAWREFLQSHQNPVLQRELRVALRNTRTFLLLAIYVSVLGAIVLAQFPAEASLTVPGNGAQSTGTLGRQLFWNFMGAQLVLVWALVPLLATGTLAQERERHTLEPLLLSPLTPLQIVWGKAAGVLALMMLLLLGTLPLTSLCFLLGGVAPGELVGGYGVLLAMALIFTGVGLYSAARWHSPVRAVLSCYAILIFFCLPIIPLVLIFGAVPIGLFIIGWLIHSGWRALKVWAEQSAERFGIWGRRACVLLGLAVTGALILLFWRDSSFGQLVIYLVFIAPCLVYLAFLPLQQAAEQLSQMPAQQPRMPTREWMDAMHAQWQSAVAPPVQVYLPEPTGKFTYSPQVPRPAASTWPTTIAVPRSPVPVHEPEIPLRQSAPTYGVKAFLPDSLNPVFTRDLRAGVAGKAKYLFRFSYIAVIATEILLLLYSTATLGSAASSAQAANWFFGWGRLHLFVLMLSGSWLGARAIAPEREKQVLPQLLATPLTASTIISGKMMAVAVYTFYIFMLGLPLALMLPPLGLLAWNSALYFLLVELVCGTLAASWGVFCSLQGVTARRAIGLSLSGILILALGGPMARAVLDLRFGTVAPKPEWLEVLRASCSPLGLLIPSLPGTPPGALGALALYLLLSFLLLALVSRAFHRYSQSH